MTPEHDAAPAVSDEARRLIEDLREKALNLHRQAWLALNGGQELTLEALDAERDAETLDAALATQEPPHAL